MNKSELYKVIIQRMKNFNISFEKAREEIKEIYPKYSDILDELIEADKTKIEMSKNLWQEILTLMYMVAYSQEFSENGIQRQLGIVSFLYNREFDDNGHNFR